MAVASSMMRAFLPLFLLMSLASGAAGQAREKEGAQNWLDPKTTIEKLAMLGREFGRNARYSEISITDARGTRHTLDSRPSDAIALAVRTKAPVYVSEEVMQTASYPDFGAVEKDEESKEVAEFHDFVEGLTPDDFSQPDRQS